MTRLLTALLGVTRAALIAALAVLPLSLPQSAYAAATTQTTHAFLCAPRPSSGNVGPQRVVNTSTTAATAYILNGAGCALFASTDIGFFLAQGYTYGPSTFVLQQTGITATQTSSTSNITLPAYGYILAIVLSETAGNAITGGVDIGDATSATTFASAVALAANTTVNLADSATVTRINVPSGVPTADQILVKCHTSCNSGSVNITILYSYF